MAKQKEFYIDFGSWHIMARDESEAMKKAEKKLIEEDIPPIDKIAEL